MSYDFHSVQSRIGSDSLKWQRYRNRDVLPMWVADMDFHAAPEIVAAIERRAREGIYGYSRPVQSVIDAVMEYHGRQFGWGIEAEWIVWIPGLVPGLNMACRAVGTRGDAVLVPCPVYPPFLTAPQLSDRRCVRLPFRREGDKWLLDWEAMEAAVTPETRLVLFCHPHNPIGRVWTRTELLRLADFCLRHQLVLCTDEVHCDLILDENPFVSVATLGPEIADRCITLNSPSKTYNVAGLACAYAVIPNARLRAAFRQAGSGMLAEMNPFGLVACEASYRFGEPWRQAMLAQLRRNRDLLYQAVAQGNLPGVAMTPFAATYLAWMDVESLRLEDPASFFEAAGVGLSSGGPFGDPRCVRLNFGCPESTVVEALKRMSRALRERA